MDEQQLMIKHKAKLKLLPFLSEKGADVTDDSKEGSVVIT